MTETPRFGSADLTNCEREPIHLAGSIQPHGYLLVLEEPDWRVIQVSANVAELLGQPVEEVLGSTLGQWGGDAASQLSDAAPLATTDLVAPIRLSIGGANGLVECEGIVHWIGTAVVLEFEALAEVAGSEPAAPDAVPRILSRAAAKLSAASTQAALCEATVRVFRQLTGYDRVMVYRFDADGHGEVVAEARRPELESYLGLHYPATDIPQRARELYLKNRVRVLVDVDYTPSPLVPELVPGTDQPLDMSLCYLRSMSPLHLQYLQNMGVTGTLVSSLVRDGKLWGLVACHHYSPKRAPYEVRAACEMLSEVFSARLSTLERQAQAEVERSVLTLQRMVIESVSATGDWRPALFAVPRSLLQLVGASGAALVYDKEVMTAGQVPSTTDLLALTSWIGRRQDLKVFETSALARLESGFEHLTQIASGVLAVSLSEHRADYLIWFRREQPQTVTWAGDPRKPMVGDDPLHLSPRRSFAVWSEAVRGTAAPWSAVELATAAAFRASLSEIVLQIQGVRALIAHHQLDLVARVVKQGWEPVVLARPSGEILVANQSFYKLVGAKPGSFRSLADVALCFLDSSAANQLVTTLLTDHIGWSGELRVLKPDGTVVPVALRADVVPNESGDQMGFLLLLRDVTDQKRANEVRENLGRVIESARDPELEARLDTRSKKELADMMDAILANASQAADVVGPAAVSSLEDVESLTKRAARLTRQIMNHSAANRRRT